jgi:hypothetical protein
MPDQHQLDGRKVLGCKCWFFHRKSTYPLAILTHFDKVKTQDVGKQYGLYLTTPFCLIVALTVYLY